MRITLKKEIPIQLYSVRMSVYVSEERPEIFPLLKAVEEANNSTPDTIQYLNKTLFPNFSKKFVENVIEELRLLDLVDYSHRLTERGKETLNDNVVLTPDEGAFEIKVVQDIFFPHAIIEINPLEPDLKQELRDHAGAEIISKIDVPDFIQESKGKKFRTLEPKPRTISIHEIEKKGSVNKRFSGKLVLILSYDGGSWQARVSIKEKYYPVNLPVNFDSALVIDTILQSISSKADFSNWQIPQNPINLKLNEITNFIKDFKRENMKIESLGSFTSVSLFEVPIFPDNQKSAEKWAKQVFIERKCSEYMTREKFELLWQYMIHEFPQFQSYQLGVPNQKEILGELQFGSMKYWFLQAPIDFDIKEAMIND